MAEPDWNPDTGGRSLAEILREAGIESANRAARRRSWDDPEETGIRQRRAEAAAADGAAGRTGQNRRRSDASEAPPPAVERRQQPDRRQARPPLPDSHTAAIPGIRPDRKPGVPAAAPMPSAPVPVRERPLTDGNPTLRDPSLYTDREVALREFICPGCATMLESEIVVDGAAPQWDVRVS